MLALPFILYDDKYKDQWEFDGWKPVAKETADSKVKDAIAEWLEEIQEDETTEDDDFVVQM